MTGARIEIGRRRWGAYGECARAVGASIYRQPSRHPFSPLGPAIASLGGSSSSSSQTSMSGGLDGLGTGQHEWYKLNKEAAPLENISESGTMNYL
jgi:hypothetical protein